MTNCKFFHAVLPQFLTLSRWAHLFHQFSETYQKKNSLPTERRNSETRLIWLIAQLAKKTFLKIFLFFVITDLSWNSCLEVLYMEELGKCTRHSFPSISSIQQATARHDSQGLLLEYIGTVLRARLCSVVHYIKQRRLHWSSSNCLPRLHCGKTPKYVAHCSSRDQWILQINEEGIIWDWQRGHFYSCW